jgi:ABC-type xylose transport system permease subunit
MDGEAGIDQAMRMPAEKNTKGMVDEKLTTITTNNVGGGTIMGGSEQVVEKMKK